MPDVVREHGGTPVRTRVRRSYIKAEIARNGALFGGEHSVHYYFRDFWFTDSGMLAALHVIAALGGQRGPLSELVGQYKRYAASGEINSVVRDQQHTLTQVRETCAGWDGAVTDGLDGLTISVAEWWLNLRPSNTEPLLRLNVEAPDTETVARLCDEVLAIVRD